MKKNFPLRIRRKSFDVEEAKKSHEHGPSGTVGRNLGFWMTAYLGFQTLGSIYGDIGTSPLYVYTGIFPNSTGPPAEDVLGAASCIVWSLTLVPLIKYSWLVLRAGDDQGEGGTFVLYMLLSRYLNLDKYTSNYSIQQMDSLMLTTTETLDSTSDLTGRSKHAWVRETKVVRLGFLVWTLFGASCVMADGLLTPAVSVISAVSGIAVPAPDLNNSIVPISIGVLVFLFIIQQFGTKRISLLFAPIVGLWFAALFITGIINIHTNDSGIFRAYNPVYAINYLVRIQDLNVLGGVLLAITGVEALFADLGHYNRQSIQWTFTLVTYPSLVIAYLGQAAALENHPEWISNTFYNSIPGGPGSGIYWLVFVLATLATIIASQAMILATFSIIHQAMQLDCFPPLKVVHTDPKVVGRVYMPFINWILMIVIILVCLGYGTSTHLTDAYGLTVASVMFVTTTLLASVMYFVWGFIWIIPLGFLLLFGTLDGVFWASTLRKFATGAWFPFMVGVIMTTFMMFWRWGMTKKRQYEWDRRVRLGELLRREGELPAISGEGAFRLGEKHEYPSFTQEVPPSEGEKQVTPDAKSSTSKDSMAISPVAGSENTSGSLVRRRSGQQLYLRASETPVYRLPGISIFYTSAPTSHSHAPHTFRHFLEHFPALHSTCIFLHVRIASQPHVPNEEKLVLEASPLWEGVWRGVYRVGYMEIPDFSSADFTVRLFAKMSREVEGLTHVMQYTKLVARKEREARGDVWWKRIPESVRAWGIDVVWSGVDEVIGGVGKGWKVPVGEVVSVGAVAEV